MPRCMSVPRKRQTLTTAEHPPLLQGWVFCYTGGDDNMPGGRTNPRYANGTLRRKHRARMKAMGLPCGICGGRLGPIHYDEPSDAQHPLSFVIDEIKPVSRWKQFGYDSARAAAQDWDNLQAAHYCCNAAKSNRIVSSMDSVKRLSMEPDGEW